jgi:hypothetical protein
MKQLLSLFLFLLPCLALAQYPSNGNQKITLGEQTSADGLIYRGLAADTTRKPSIDTMAYIILDTATNIQWHYKKATSNAWLRVGGSISSGLTGVLPVANGGTGASSFSPNNYLIRTNSSGIFDTSAVYEAGGNVGIGTASPLANFEVAGISSNTDFRISRTVSSDAYMSISAPGGLPNVSKLGVNGTDVLNLSSTGAATFSSSVTGNRYIINGSNGNAGQIIQQGDLLGTAGTNLLLQSNTGNAIGFLTNGGTTFNMFINTNGNVGIGSTNPFSKFLVNNGTNINLGIKFGQTDATAVMLNAVNDAVTANIPMEFRASKFSFQNGNVGIGQTTPTAVLHLKAGTATASTAPLKFTSGTNLTTAEAGAMEFNGTNLFFSPSTTRHTVNHGLTGSATLNFPSTLTMLSADLTITVTGAADGDVVSLGVPNAAVNANTFYSAWVSAANTVTVRFNNYSIGTVDPASALFKVFVTK